MSDEAVIETREKVKRLYQYIAELNKIHSKNILDFNAPNSYEWKLPFSDIPESADWIKLSFRDVENSDDASAILTVKKPDLPICPAPDESLKEWLHRGYDDAQYDGVLYIEQKATETGTEFFKDSLERVNAYENWHTKRSAWARKYNELKVIQDFFIMLYGRYSQLEQMSDSMELVAGNGFVYDSSHPEFNHPILFHRVKLTFISAENIIQIVDADDDSEIYESFIRSMEDIYIDHFKEFKGELEELQIHPLDRNGAADFLKRLVASLCQDSRFVNSEKVEFSNYKNRVILYMKPVFFIRKKQDGIQNAVQTIIADIDNGGVIPPYIGEIVSAGKIDKVDVPEDQSLESLLASVGGEDPNILLSKEANNEQLEIAKRIERYNAVLVQGPPGTGKTHTIANLLGHFLAQGKKVLVTSHTKKALTVLKEKVVSGLQSLCVSVLDDSREDMERSVNGITEYMSKNDSTGLKRDMEKVGFERRQVIKDLGDVRKRIFELIQKECHSLDICGDRLSPSQAASFVVDNAEKLSYIPGKVTLGVAQPLTYDELRELYSTNNEITAQEEREFSYALPSLSEIPKPEDYSSALQTMQQENDFIRKFEAALGCSVKRTFGSNAINITESDKFKGGSFNGASVDLLKSIANQASVLKSMKQWQVAAAVDGKNGGAVRDRWNTLIQQIRHTNEICDKLIAISFGKTIEIMDTNVDLRPIVARMRAIFREKGSISKLSRLLNRDFNLVFGSVTISGRPFASAEDCEFLIQHLEYQQELKKCSSYWHNLVSIHGDEPELEKLPSEYPIKVALNMVQDIENALAWNEHYLVPLMQAMASAQIPLQLFIESSGYFNPEYVNRILESAKVIKAVVSVLISSSKLAETELNIQHIKSALEANGRIYSDTCKSLIQAIDAQNAETYASAYEALRYILNKNDILQKRKSLLSKLDGVAPDWADAIRRREGIHGENIVPATIADAWKWKQCAGTVKGIIAEPYDALQKKSMELGKRYREITAEYAEKSAWYHLLQETECNIDLKQSLIGWKQITKKIGKGTGKNAARFRAEARSLMAKCQTAVPAWIMPMSKVFESLVPGKNIFDIIIIDEASQADISALALLYMARKAIIVGDDQQVSPMAVGIDINQSNNLVDMYLKNVIPNYNLYDLKSSVYDIANTTFQPLMLREHFRCVPEIIGFSNALSYEGKIKPMLDGSKNKLLPSVVSYHVDGLRVGKRNTREAVTIVALLKSCLMQPEYENTTFGIISLLGTDQAKEILAYLYAKIEPRDLEKHKVLCGDAANFQGDERDVIFLSLVDSPNSEGMLRIVNEGVDDSTKKRYNVASSRARNQMWVVHSLNPASDLKADDMRKRLIDYAQNPSSQEAASKTIEKKSDSTFEDMVAKALSEQGYSVTMQYPVGAYRLDMVVRYGNRQVALECNGERNRNGEDKIREDMEQVAILERIGWQFIKVRGSEYFSNPAKTIERIVSELTAYGVLPNDAKVPEASTSSDLFDRVQAQAAKFLTEWSTPSTLI